ncbi:hypothetical protein GGQ61_002479 [Phenylobacterium haematophilum]|uniref:Sel1 repeat family protein n=1 Tax=Phenylobacterium haematophilum TaxID=98513 RepID=A0A840A2M4_9CAUL|nr:hypothetical protein [Phenylobacterium haematophilum]MBB3891751.1 hypothetical protein [Phenylobacterium haematophilum]
MSRKLTVLTLGALLIGADPALAQPAVEVTPLAAPDFFANGARDTGLPADLWRGASVETARTVLPLIAVKPLSPAAAALARRVLATGANGPEGAGQDRDLAGVRIAALVAQGGVKDAGTILSRTSGLESNPAMAQAGAEAALLAGQDERACDIGERLASGREEIYWLRLRAYCLARDGQSDAARVTFDLAQGVARDAVYGRLMGAKLAGTGNPGAASLRGGLDYALSRSLGLDLAAATPAPAVAAALAAEEPGAATWSIESGPGPLQAAMAAVAVGDLAGAQTLRAGLTADATPVNELALLDGLIAAAGGKADGPTLDRLVERGAVADAKTRGKMQNAAILLAALGAPMTPQARGEFAKFAGAEAGKATVARGLALDLAGEARLMGETALLALWISADAGAAGPATGDRARIVRALRAAGLEADARAFAVEGLLAQR